MSELTKFAEDELRIAGWFKEWFREDDEIGQAMASDVMELIETFDAQGHSGMSALMCIRLFTELASYHNLTPLTGEDDEWIDRGNGCFQNKRLSTVFKEGDRVYRIDGKIFRYPDGNSYTSRDSCVDIAFPYEYCEPIIVDRME